ncbi:hypothetical protein [Mycobacterium marinum]|uniref:hypothetical protein n=1 Tax=Mycobacterium marinum TaxID=1781 RepID=UPI003561E0F3
MTVVAPDLRRMSAIHNSTALRSMSAICVVPHALVVELGDGATVTGDPLAGYVPTPVNAVALAGYGRGSFSQRERRYR